MSLIPFAPLRRIMDSNPVSADYTDFTDLSGVAFLKSAFICEICGFHLNGEWEKGSEPSIYSNHEEPGHEPKLDWKSRTGVNTWI
jgi:hypothetical protein